MASLTYDAPDLLSSDPLLPNVGRQGQARQVLALPWTGKRLRLGTCFHSNLAHTEAPFSDSPPLFASTCAGTYRPSGADASFRSSDSSSAGSSSEHLSTALGVSAGCPFLRASVTGQYDRDVLSNFDDCKTSVAASYRCGTVSLSTPPRLTTDALLVLKYGGGLEALKQRYGDYYVAAYVLGADAGALVSRSSSASTVAERLQVTVKLKVLFWTASHTESKSWSNSTSAARVSVSAFSTLGPLRLSASAAGGSELQRLAADAKAVLASIDNVPARVEATVAELGVRPGEKAVVGEDMCDGLCDSGLVVELVLMPIETLREVQAWATSTDII
ncbi:hypothetical protein BFW01_g1471 [Lasiodiplodia theobromae]|nr:hypothetical protein BFW01_g1471 [Lasiodiplodia theobromae]